MKPLTPKAEIAEGDPPPANYNNRPAPFKPGGNPSNWDAFLPYLALGFSLVYTAGGGERICGLYAIWTSLKAAQAAFTVPVVRSRTI
jgi:hypothetical protein